MKEVREVFDYLKACPMFFLATVDSDQPRVRPFGAIDIFEEKLYIQTGNIKPVFKQMKANPKLKFAPAKETAPGSGSRRKPSGTTGKKRGNICWTKTRL